MSSFQLNRFTRNNSGNFNFVPIEMCTKRKFKVLAKNVAS